LLTHHIILYEIGLSEEKFLRIISLLRRIGRIPSTFDSEWSLRKIKRKLATEHEFAELVASLIVDGKRVFINFVDGGGWLARKRDFERLVENCDYFLNLYNLDMLEGILAQYLP
jgi:hypothetical protein